MKINVENVVIRLDLEGAKLIKCAIDYMLVEDLVHHFYTNKQRKALEELRDNL